MQKTSAQANGFPQRDRTESEWHGGVQTFMWMREDNIVEVPFDKEHLLESILGPGNLNKACLAVVRNMGCGGIDKMPCGQMLPWLMVNKNELIRSLLEGTCRPNPVRRAEIPKDNGKKRRLGIPTAVDRVIQQAIAQILTPIHERQSSGGSHGFRPRRGGKKALAKGTGSNKQRAFANGHIVRTPSAGQGCPRTTARSAGWAYRLSTNTSMRGVMANGKHEETREGTPQGGPPSPLLANILPNELDKELERRGHPFVRHADDGLIFCKGRRAAGRVKEGITKFIGSTPGLRVNREKTESAHVGKLKFLGCGFHIRNGKCRLRLHQKTEAKMRRRLKAITSRSNGMGHAKRKAALKEYPRGWTEYYNLADMGNKVKETDQWLRRRIRMCIWKAWKRPKTRVRNLIKCGIDKWQAYEWGNTSKGYWRMAGSWMAAGAMPDGALHRAGHVWTGCYYKASALLKG